MKDLAGNEFVESITTDSTADVPTPKYPDLGFFLSRCQDKQKSCEHGKHIFGERCIHCVIATGEELITELSALRAELEQEKGNSKEWQRNYQESERQATEMMNMRDAQRRAKEATEVKLSISQDEFNTLESVYKIACEMLAAAEAANAKLSDLYSAWMKRAVEAEAREAALREDAERYREIRENGIPCTCGDDCGAPCGDELDSDVDAAREGKEPDNG